MNIETKEAFLSRDCFDQLPSLDFWVYPYKNLALHLPDDQFPKLTAKQHQIAKQYGFTDWQSFHYWLKTKRELLNGISLSNDEWGYIFDMCNGMAIERNSFLNHSERLCSSIIDADRYEYLSGKWFDDWSKIDDDNDEWEPSAAMRSFLYKVNDLTEDQALAVLLKGLTFWKKTLYLS